MLGHIGFIAILSVCLFTSSADAQVRIHSGGGFVQVDNWTNEAVVVGIEGPDGEFIPFSVLPPQSWADYPIPPGFGGVTVVVLGLESGKRVEHTISSDADIAVMNPRLYNNSMLSIPHARSELNARVVSPMLEQKTIGRRPSCEGAVSHQA